MSERMQAIIRGIEIERDQFVRRCNAAIDALRSDAAGIFENHRFNTKNAAPRVGGKSIHTGRGKQSRISPLQHYTSAENASVKDIIREAVLSQTQPFTLHHIRDYIETRYPGVAGKIAGGRYSKELYHLRVTERQFDIASKGEKGVAHVYKIKAA